MLEVRSISKRFGRLQALANVEFQIGSGQIKAIIGPNGAGKTTFVNVLTGSLYPDEGTISLDGSIITRTPPFKRARAGIGRTYQIPKPFLNLTVFENVLLGAIYAGRRNRKDAEVDAARAIDLVGLNAVRNIVTRNLTLEQMKFVDLGRALAAKPKYLFIDELGAGLSESELSKIAQLVRRIVEVGTSVVYIGHIMRLVSEISHSVVVFNEGKNIFEGTYEEASTDPQILRIYLGDQFKS